MNVQELIAELQKYPRETKVYCEDDWEVTAVRFNPETPSKYDDQPCLATLTVESSYKTFITRMGSHDPAHRTHECG